MLRIEFEREEDGRWIAEIDELDGFWSTAAGFVQEDQARFISLSVDEYHGEYPPARQHYVLRGVPIEFC